MSMATVAMEMWTDGAEMPTNAMPVTQIMINININTLNAMPQSCCCITIYPEEIGMIRILLKLRKK